MAFVILAVFGIICALLAHGKGRSAIGWFVIGFIAPLLGIILVLVLPNQKANERRLDQMNQQNRRLRERLRQTRLANRRKLAEVNKRLNAHDRSLDVDTANDEEPSQLEYDNDDDDGEGRQQVQSPQVRNAARQGKTPPAPAARAQSSGVRFDSEEPPATPRNRASVQAPPAGPRRPPLQRRRPS